MTKTGFLFATTAFGLVLSATTAHTAGYAIKETSAAQVGQSFAGSAALKGDVSAMWNNPATMTTLNGHHFAAAASYIIPSAKFKDGGGSTANGNNGGDGGVHAVVPALYALWSIQDNMKLGVAVTAPFGLSTKYDSTWKGRFNSVKSEMKSLNINPNFAYKLNEWVSLGMGFSVQYVEIELTKKIDNRTFGPAGEANFKATGHDYGAGFNVGALFNVWEGGRFGVAFRSKITHGLKGETEITGVAAAAAAGANLNNGITKIDADLTTPETLDFSYAQDLGEAWTVMASAVWTRWARFNELKIQKRDRLGINNGIIGKSERQNWKNVWFFALGANWKVAKDWMLRAGVAFDQSPIDDKYRTSKLPGNDRTWLSTGVDWSFNDWGKVALTYTHIFVRDGKINQTDGAGGALPAGNTLQGKVHNSVDIIGLQANIKF